MRGGSAKCIVQFRKRNKKKSGCIMKWGREADGLRCPRELKFANQPTNENRSIQNTRLFFLWVEGYTGVYVPLRRKRRLVRIMVCACSRRCEWRRCAVAQRSQSEEQGSETKRWMGAKSGWIKPFSS